MVEHNRLTAMEIYRDLMEEARMRIEGLEYLLSGTHGFGPGYVTEFGYLQLRFLAEIIAIASLVAHGDIPDIAGLRNQSEADLIVKKITHHHPDFYPSPVRRERMGDGHVHLHDGPSDYLKKEELVQLVHIAGGKLHKGKLKNILRKNSSVQHKFPDIEQWLRKIINLLREHRIMFKDGSGFFYCALKDETVCYRVNIVLAASNPAKTTT